MDYVVTPNQEQQAVRRLTVEALRSTIPNLRMLFEPFISFQGILIPWESFNRCILMSVNLGIQFALLVFLALFVYWQRTL